MHHIMKPSQSDCENLQFVPFFQVVIQITLQNMRNLQPPYSGKNQTQSCMLEYIKYHFIIQGLRDVSTTY